MLTPYSVQPRVGLIALLVLSAALLACPGTGFLAAGSVLADEPTGLNTTDLDTVYLSKVQPLLKERCYSCHSHAARKSRGGLAVDSREALITGGESGAAIVPGKPEESVLIDAVKRDGLEMPPEGKGEPLNAAEIELLERWIRDGAHAPAAIGPSGPKKRRPGALTDEDRKWWALQPLKGVAPPALASHQDTDEPEADNQGAPLNEIDCFIRDRLKREGLTPAPTSPPRVLARRLTFDLTGLPPTAIEAVALVSADPNDSTTGAAANGAAANDTITNAKNADQAYQELVDRLLDSPRFGERMARHWLDLVRYADSDGYRIDDYRPDAWRYRDYVIRAFNADKPYDRFVQEQLAGDELFPGDPEALIATGYLRHWIYEYNNRDVRGQWTTILNDVTDTTADVFLGVGLQCARCHDHKFDPLLQRDYYRLQAFFAPLQPREDLVAATAEQRAAHEVALTAWHQKTESIRSEIAELEKKYRHNAVEGAVKIFPEDIQVMIRKPAAERTPVEAQLVALAWRQVEYEFNRLDSRIKGEDKERLIALRKQLAEFDSLKPAPLPIAFAVSDVGTKASPVLIPKKGDDPIEPGFLTLLDPEPARIEALPQSPQTTGRRAALALWLTRPDNPLTARIIVNRVWQQHFGRGLAANASDFGTLGEPPSHPELLDWLSAWFQREGWSLKKLHRLIVMSATYRQSSLHPDPEPGRLLDPENKLLWRCRPHRLEAEQIRDAVFAVTGELQLEPSSGPGVLASAPRRSIFTRILRNTRDPLADVFDAPLWFASASSRDNTTTPVQSLMLVNSPFLLQRSRSFAARLQKLSPGDEAGQVVQAYRLAYGREPSSSERENALRFIAAQRPRINAQLASSAQAAFVPEKIPYRDGQAALIEPGGAQRMFRATESAGMQPEGDFTIEAFVQPRTIAEDGAVRVIAAKWSGDMKQPGWCIGITGKGSRRKPQTVVLQSVGRKRNGSIGEVAVFSDQHIALNKPYFIAVSVKLATKDSPGNMAFFLKDLSNDDEPLLIANVEHDLIGGLENDEAFTIGGRGHGSSHFHGAIDDVRFSRGAIGAAQLLINVESVTGDTRGYWRFEARPDVLHDSTEFHHHLEPASITAKAATNVPATALADFCHALLNSSEFLYVE